MQWLALSESNRQTQWIARKDTNVTSTITAPIIVLAIAVTLQADGEEPAATTPTQSVNIQLTPTDNAAATDDLPRFTARFTTEDIKPLLTERSDLLPLPFHYAGQIDQYTQAIDRVCMSALVQELSPYLSQDYAERFSPGRDTIRVQVPQDQQVEIKDPELPGGTHRGPTNEMAGFLIHDITEDEYLRVAVRVLQTARKILDTGDPAVDRQSAQYRELAARAESNRILQDRHAKQASKITIGKALGIYKADKNVFEGQPKWVKESRRFTYVVKDGKFIDRLRPMVDRINRQVAESGFSGPAALDRPGIHFDEDLQDVEIVLPESMLKEFLETADVYERRMAEDAIISIEALRLTDREIINGAIASRMNLNSFGVHDVNRWDQGAVARQAGINSLLAVANRELAITNLREIGAGTVPADTPPLTLPAITFPDIPTERTFTTIGGDLSMGADDVFFDGREQNYGFSYVGPDGLTHNLSLDVVDSLRELWERIERNLIVHKIKRTEHRETFHVPVGPETKTFDGIAALISQQNQTLVVTTETGALSELSATAGTWLVVQDFDILPTPGSSTSLTDDEHNEIEHRLLLTMLLRDPQIDPAVKIELVDADSRAMVEAHLDSLYDRYRHRHVNPSRNARTYEQVFAERQRDAVEDASTEKKELNSRITLTFYSSQGNIVVQPGNTSLGDANDLTSFTTELCPNKVTPIASFFTKTAGGTKDSSQITGWAKGENSNEEKTMSHLVVRARFPTTERNRGEQYEGRHLGYFALPIDRTPHSTVDLPFLSSSMHPLERLSALRVGLMFPVLQKDRVRQSFELFHPNKLLGTIPKPAWELASARALLNAKIISDSPNESQSLAARYGRRFEVEIRSLLEYDEDFFDAPNVALRNMAQWNDPFRIVSALNGSTQRFALHRLIAIIDELGQLLISDQYADDFLGRSPSIFFKGHPIHDLTQEELTTLRRDSANHFLRFEETYGDAFMEAVSMILGLGTYTATDRETLEQGPFRGYSELTVFDNSATALAAPQTWKAAHQNFLHLKAGGHKGKLFKPSLEYLEHVPPQERKFITRGTEIVTRPTP